MAQPTTTRKKLVSFSGECREGKQMVAYTEPSVARPGVKDRADREVNDSGETTAKGRQTFDIVFAPASV